MQKVLLSIGQLSGGGAERVVSVWANQLVDANIDVTILVYGRMKNEYPVSPNVKIETITPDYKDYCKLNYFQRVAKARQVLKTIKPNVVISFLPRNQITMMFASFGLKTKRIETVRLSPWHTKFASVVEKWLWHLCFFTCDSFIIQTKEQSEYFPKVIRNKAIVIPNPLSLYCINNYKLTFSNTIRKFIAAGRIDKQKNYELMITAFKIVTELYEDACLDIYGAGDENYCQSIERLIQKNGLQEKVKLCGKTNQINQKMLDCDAFLMTSDYEGMPNALIEAMALKMVCISTECRTGPKDLIIDGVNGYLTPIKNVSILSQKIINVCALQKSQAICIGEKAREQVLKLCSEENSLKRLLSIIEEG